MYFSDGNFSDDEQDDNIIPVSPKHGLKKIPPLKLNLVINDVRLRFIVDTGADVSTLPLGLKKKYFPLSNIVRTRTVLRNFDRTPIFTFGVIDKLTVRYGSVTTHDQRLFIVRDNRSNLVGKDWLYSLKMWPPILEQKKNDAESDIEGCIHLPVNPNCKPISLPVRIVPFNLRDKLNKYIDSLVRNKLIVPVESSAWGTSVEPLTLPDGRLTFVSEYRLTINKYLQRDNFVLPAVNNIITNLRGKRNFCMIKLLENENFLKIPLDNQSQEMATIVTPQGLFKPLYLPVETRNAYKIYHKYITKGLIKYNVDIIGDYLCVYGETLIDTCDQLTSSVKTLQEMGLSVNNIECSYFIERLKVFGVEISKNNIIDLKSNVQPLKKLPRPTNIELLTSFLSMVNYFGKFLQSVFYILKPLVKFPRSNANFRWTRQCEKSFTVVTKILEITSSVSFLKPNTVMILNCDSSDHGIAAVLSAVDSTPMVKPIAFASRKLEIGERLYSKIEKDALAIIYGMNEFYDFLWGRRFILETRNRKLYKELQENNEMGKHKSSELNWWLTYFRNFDYNVIYNRSDHNAADYLAQVV